MRSNSRLVVALALVAGCSEAPRDTPSATVHGQVVQGSATTGQRDLRPLKVMASWLTDAEDPGLGEADWYFITGVEIDGVMPSAFTLELDAPPPGYEHVTSDEKDFFWTMASLHVLPADAPEGWIRMGDLFTQQLAESQEYEIFWFDRDLGPNVDYIGGDGSAVHIPHTAGYHLVRRPACDAEGVCNGYEEVSLDHVIEIELGE